MASRLESVESEQAQEDSTLLDQCCFPVAFHMSSVNITTVKKGRYLRFGHLVLCSVTHTVSMRVQQTINVMLTHFDIT